MNAVVKPVPVWQSVVDHISWERQRGRAYTPIAVAEFVINDSADAVRYVQENGESVICEMAEALTDVEDRHYETLERRLIDVAVNGEKMPAKNVLAIVEQMQALFVARVTARIARRIDREGL